MTASSPTDTTDPIGTAGTAGTSGKNGTSGTTGTGFPSFGVPAFPFLGGISPLYVPAGTVMYNALHALKIPTGSNPDPRGDPTTGTTTTTTTTGVEVGTEMDREMEMGAGASEEVDDVADVGVPETLRKEPEDGETGDPFRTAAESPRMGKTIAGRGRPTTPPPTFIPSRTPPREGISRRRPDAPSQEGETVPLPVRGIPTLKITTLPSTSTNPTSQTHSSTNSNTSPRSQLGTIPNTSPRSHSSTNTTTASRSPPGSPTTPAKTPVTVFKQNCAEPKRHSAGEPDLL
jgi:hypothetical protein